MNCPGCRARNPIGNKFCRECGQKIPLEENTLAQEEAQQAELERARERAAQLLTKAFALSQQGKPAEALPLAEEAAELLPASTSALTLSSTLYERLGQNAKAIAMMEKVVALNPHSAVDIDKLDRLRRGVHLLPSRPPLAEKADVTERRWVPLAAALGVGALVMTVGGIVLVKSLGKKGPAPLVVTEVGKPANTPGFFSNSQRYPMVQPGGAGPLSPPQVPSQIYRDPFKPLRNATPYPRENTTYSSEPRVGRPSGSPVLPNPRDVNPGSNLSQGGGVPPMPVPENGGFPRRNGLGLPPLGGVQGNPDPIPAGPPPSNPNPSIPASNPRSTGEPPAENSGYIRVREHTAPSGGGGKTSTRDGDTATRGSDPLLRAQTLQASGKYREALTSFREALSAGAAVGEVQQGIALCHQRLGEKAPARAAYQQAISAFEAQVHAGRSVDQASRGVAACRAALDVLGNL